MVTAARKLYISVNVMHVNLDQRQVVKGTFCLSTKDLYFSLEDTPRSSRMNYELIIQFLKILDPFIT